MGSIPECLWDHSGISHKLSVGSRWDHGGIVLGFTLGYPAAANSRQQVASRQQFNSRLGIHVRHSCCCATTRCKEKGSEKTATKVKDVPRQNGTDVVGLDKHREYGAPFVLESDARSRNGKRMGHPPTHSLEVRDKIHNGKEDGPPSLTMPSLSPSHVMDLVLFAARQICR